MITFAMKSTRLKIKKKPANCLRSGKANNRLEWTDLTFDVIREILLSRGVEIPPQNVPDLIIAKSSPPDITYMGFIGFYFSARGRVGLASYWLFAILPYFFLTVIIRILMDLFMNDLFLDGSTYYFIVLFVVQLFLIWCLFAMAIKRCHDRDKSGWFILINLIPIIGGIWFFIETCCLPGSKGPNQFGTKSF